MRALVLSGGGSKGAYEAGVISYLMDVEEQRYDLFCGVSVGALNAAFLAQFIKEPNRADMWDMNYAANDLLGLWSDMNSSKVYKNWVIPYLSALWKPSVFNSAPLRELVFNNIKIIRTPLRIGATALDSGEYRVFDETYGSLSHENDIREVVLASSAFPGMLCPVEIEGQLYADGGICNNTPLREALRAGATEIDVILCSPLADPSTLFKDRTTALSVGLRAISLMSDQLQRNDLIDVKFKCPAIKIRVVEPSVSLISNCLDFSPSEIGRMIGVGQSDAMRILGNK